MSKVITGLERLISSKELQNKINGNIGYLCHSASVDSNFKHGILSLMDVFGERLTKIFGPQHGFVTDVQDNMIETDHYIHPYFKRPIYSLYSETRVPTDEMLEGLDSIIIDLQDVGTRVYTYISTMSMLMEVCAKKDIHVFILDRPNPVGGEIIEGTILEPEFVSFVGRHPIPQRHGLTMGEMALLAKKFHGADCPLTIIEMVNWKRAMFYQDTGLPWVNPSPNLPTMDGAITFAGTVLYEGTKLSEGRGTTRSLEVIGHPSIEPFSFYDKVKKVFDELPLKGFELRPLMFHPMFQKFAGKSCGGLHIHVTDPAAFESWTVSQILCREFYHHLGSEFEWQDNAYEYENDKMAIDLINGTEKVKHWIENNGSYEELKAIEEIGRSDYLQRRSDILIY
jgi:uncharacterized protein YbbC (DUF1343 family)